MVLRLSLLPHALSDAMGHIRTILFQLLMRYMADLGGVVLTFANIKLR